MPAPPPRAAIGRVPLALPTAAITLGAAIGLGARDLPWLLVVPVCLAVLCAGDRIARRRRAARLAAGALLLGLVLGRVGLLRERPPRPLAEARVPAVHVLHGTVAAVELPAYGAQRIHVDVDALGEPPVALPRCHRMPVTVRLRGRGTWRWHDVVPDSRIRVLARLSARRDGLRAVVTDRRGLVVLARGEGPAAALARTRRRATWVFARHLDRRDAGLARALLLGDRGRLDRRDRDLCRRTGQAHLLAVSGLHVGLLVGGFVLLLRALGAGLRATWCAALVLAALYVPFTGAPASAVRAGVGAVAWFVGALTGRAPRGLAVLVLVALLVLVVDARHLGSISFQLSFAAVTSILLLASRIRTLLVGERLVLHRLAAPARAPIRTAFAVSAAAWLGTAPLVALHIGRLCPAGPFLAVPAVPLAAALLACGFGTLLTAASPPVAAAAAGGFALCADALRGLLACALHVHLGARDAHAPTAVWGTLYVVAFALAARATARRMHAGFGGLVALLTLLLLPWPVPGLTRPRAAADGARAAYDAPAVILADIPAEPIVVAASAGLFVPLVALALVGFAALAVRMGWLTIGGAAAAWVLGLGAAVLYRWVGLAALFLPFLVATLLGRLPGAERAGARSLRQVVCNGFPAFMGIVWSSSIAMSDPASLDGVGRWAAGLLWFLGALACLGADTCATEIGVRYGGTPFRLLGKGPLAPGDSGGVTVIGLVASLAGATLAPGAAVLLFDLPLATFLVITAAGFLAALLDSVLGGTLQFRGRIAATGEATEATRVPGETVEPTRGWPWLDNDAVNLVSGVAGGILAIALVQLL